MPPAIDRAFDLVEFALRSMFRGTDIVLSILSAWLLPVAVAGAAVFYFTMPGPRSAFDCSAVAVQSPATRQQAAQNALSIATTLNLHRGQIYGFENRAQSHFEDVANWLGSTGSVPDPVWKARAAADIAEVSLVYDTATALGLSKCRAARLVPDLNSTSLETASRELRRLVRSLRAVAQN